MHIIRFYAVGRAVMAQKENGEIITVAVCEFDDEKGPTYDEALNNAILIAQTLTKNYSEGDQQ